jgi:hypothetical protein
LRSLVYDLCTWSTLDPRATAVGITMSFFGTYQDILLTDLDVGF